MIQLRLNDRDVSANEGQTILDVAVALGIEIPTLCHHPDLSPVGSCRVCLVSCGGEHLVPACKTLAQAGQVIETNTPHVRDARRFVLQLLLQNYRDDDDLTEIGDSPFLSLVREYGVQREEDLTEMPRFEADSDPHPFIRVDLNKCILCTRCLRACDEVQGRFVWHLAERGHDVRIVAGTGTTMLEAGCESCGACVAYCPTGALEDRLVPAETAVAFSQLAVGASPMALTLTWQHCDIASRWCFMSSQLSGGFLALALVLGFASAVVVCGVFCFMNLVDLGRRGWALRG